MFIKDRGNIKWTSLMLSEHRDKLYKIKEADNYIKKPELENHILEKMDFLFQKAFKNNSLVKFTYFENNQVLSYTGTINKIGEPEIILINLETDNSLKKLKIKNILDISIISS